MFRKVLLVCSLFIISNSFIFGDTKSSISDVDLHHLKAIVLFEGDKRGDFKNNLVAVLWDDSEWKIHPQDQKVFSNWQIKEAINIRIRTSFYWFKREHKFEFFNQDRKEVVRVMFVKYPLHPLCIEDYQTFLAGHKLGSYTTIDGQGRIKYHYYPVTLYKTRLRLNDGTSWILENSHQYTKGENVYLLEDQVDQSFILIIGCEREATWQKIKKE